MTERRSATSPADEGKRAGIRLWTTGTWEWHLNYPQGLVEHEEFPGAGNSCWNPGYSWLMVGADQASRVLHLSVAHVFCDQAELKRYWRL